MRYVLAIVILVLVGCAPLSGHILPDGTHSADATIRCDVSRVKDGREMCLQWTRIKGLASVSQRIGGI
jgi:hypothetical protein